MILALCWVGYCMLCFWPRRRNCMFH